ncbi:MAG: hypothetical protein U0694_14930 [Anaerolineae bacterium]
MSVNVYWEDHEHTLLRYDFIGKWDWNDLYFALGQGLKMEMRCINRIDVLLDLRQSGAIGDGAIAHIRKLADKQPPNVGMLVVITQSKFLTALVQATMRSYPNVALYLRLAPNETEARAMIAMSRKTDEGVVNPSALPTRRQATVDHH